MIQNYFSLLYRLMLSFGEKTTARLAKVYWIFKVGMIKFGQYIMFKLFFSYVELKNCVLRLKNNLKNEYHEST